jgi:hypothetical protein
MKLGRAALSICIGAMGLVGAAPAAHACDPGNAPCGDPVDTVVCVVEKAIYYNGPLKDFPGAADNCFLRP